MRTTLSIVLLQLAAMVGLAAIAVAQSEESNPAIPEAKLEVNNQDDDAKRDDNATQDGKTKKADGDAPLTLLNKVEEWVGLKETKLEDLAEVADWLKTEVAKKLKVQNKAANGLMRKSSRATIDQPAAAPELPAFPETPAIPSIPAPAKAEVDGSESFDSVSGDSASADEVGKYLDTMPIPVLNGSTPDWVKNGLVVGEDLSFAISSTFMADLEQCREDLKSRMMSEVRDYLDKNVLKFAEAYTLPELTQEYVEKYWVKKGQVFENIQDRPAGTFHQLWIGLHISSEQLTKIREWEKQNVREQRTRKVGIFGGVGVCVITLLSGAVGLLARREKAKLKG